MKLLSCTGCKFAGSDCDQAAKMRGSLKGLGIRTVKFACSKRQNVLQPGQAAIFNTRVPLFGEGDETLVVGYPGHVIWQKAGKVFGFVKPGTLDTSESYPFEARSNGFVMMPLARVHADPSREPASVEHCRWCGSFPALGDTRCDYDPHYTRQDQCLAKATPKNPLPGEIAP